MDQHDLTFVIPTYRLRDVGETEQYDQHFWRDGHSVRHRAVADAGRNQLLLLPEGPTWDSAARCSECRPHGVGLPRRVSRPRRDRLKALSESNRALLIEARGSRRDAVGESPKRDMRQTRT